MTWEIKLHLMIRKMKDLTCFPSTSQAIEELNMRNSLLETEKAVLESGVLESEGTVPFSPSCTAFEQKPSFLMDQFYAFPPPGTVDCTKQMDSITTEECSGYQRSDLHLEEQQEPREDRKLTV